MGRGQEKAGSPGVVQLCLLRVCLSWAVQPQRLVCGDTQSVWVKDSGTRAQWLMVTGLWRHVRLSGSFSPCFSLSPHGPLHTHSHTHTDNTHPPDPPLLCPLRLLGPSYGQAPLDRQPFKQCRERPAWPSWQAGAHCGAQATKSQGDGRPR